MRRIQDSCSLDFASSTTGLANQTKKSSPFKVNNNGSCTMNCMNDGETYSFHPRGASSLWAEGSVPFMNALMHSLLLVSLATKNGHEVIEAV